ncbi:hypothetical protein KEM54_005745 [Ascosphaera aggregata]|nr:hypothetical protein KEM54_005745 [Ascosphaera aggregata]
MVLFGILTARLGNTPIKRYPGTAVQQLQDELRLGKMEQARRTHLQPLPLLPLLTAGTDAAAAAAAAAVFELFVAIHALERFKFFLEQRLRHILE